MPKIYLTARDLSFFVLPLMLVLYIFIYPNDFKKTNNQIASLVSTEIVLDKEIARAKKMFISKETKHIEGRMFFYEKSLIEFDKESSIWYIGQIYKQNQNSKELVYEKNDLEYNLVVDEIKKRVKYEPTKIKKYIRKKSFINLKKYDLQTIFKADGVGTVIINNEIYQLYDKIDNSVQIVKILDDRVLLKKEEGKKWLYLNN